MQEWTGPGLLRVPGWGKAVVVFGGSVGGSLDRGRLWC